jgi:hypothetical protein
MCSSRSVLYACGHWELYEYCKDTQEPCLTVTYPPVRVKHNCHRCPPKKEPAVSRKPVPAREMAAGHIDADVGASSPRVDSQEETNQQTNSRDAALFHPLPLQSADRPPDRPPSRETLAQRRRGKYFRDPPLLLMTPTDTTARRISHPLSLRPMAPPPLVPRRSVLRPPAPHPTPDEYPGSPRRAHSPVTNAEEVHNAVPSVPMRAYPPHTMFQIGRREVRNQGATAPTPNQVATGANGYVAIYGQRVLNEMRRRQAEGFQRRVMIEVISQRGSIQRARTGHISSRRGGSGRLRREEHVANEVTRRNTHSVAHRMPVDGRETQQEILTRGKAR